MCVRNSKDEHSEKRVSSTVMVWLTATVVFFAEIHRYVVTRCVLFCVACQCLGQQASCMLRF